jgi:hypothetical protein
LHLASAVHYHQPERTNIIFQEELKTAVKTPKVDSRIFVIAAFCLLTSAAAFAQKTNVDWDRQAVAAAGTLPFDSVPDTDLELEGHVYEPGNEPDAEILTVSPEYFGTMGIHLLAGRTFTQQDTPLGVRPLW